MNLNYLTMLHSESVLPIFPNLLGGRNASRMRLQVFTPESLPGYLQQQTQLLDTLLNDQTNDQALVEDQEEYCTYIHTLLRSVNGSRGVPVLNLAKTWYLFNSNYMSLFYLPSHLLMPTLPQRINTLLDLLNNVQQELLNPNLELTPEELQLERLILDANQYRISLLETILNGGPIQNIVEAIQNLDQQITNSRFQRIFPDYCQARYMTENQIQLVERNMLRNALRVA